MLSTMVNICRATTSPRASHPRYASNGFSCCPAPVRTAMTMPVAITGTYGSSSCGQSPAPRVTGSSSSPSGRLIAAAVSSTGPSR